MHGVRLLTESGFFCGVSMNREEISTVVKSWGVQKQFRLKRDPSDEREAWLVETRRGPEILDGWLYGSEIRVDLPGQCFVVWSGRKQLAKKLAALHGLAFRGLDGECYLTIPAKLADYLLPLFGAKWRKVVSEAVKAQLAINRQHSPLFKKAIAK